MENGHNGCRKKPEKKSCSGHFSTGYMLLISSSISYSGVKSDHTDIPGFGIS